MYNIKEEEEELFSRWSRSLSSSEEFCPNGGLMFRGRFDLNDINEENLYTWNRPEGDEETLWLNAHKRLMILTKDLNDTNAWDIREESGGRYHLREKNENIRYKGISFYRRLNRWVYGILNEDNNSYPMFEDVQDYSEMGKFYESAPLVRINCKIEVGGSMVDNQTLVDSMNRHKKFLVEQLKLYHANIILCCGSQGGKNVIRDFIKKNIFTDLEMVPNTGEWIFYSKEHNIIVIDSYHPSTTSHTDEFLYDELMKNYVKAVGDYNIKFFPLIK